jgi:trimeric autotransporter adhesin
VQVLLSKAGDEDCQAGNVQLKARSLHARGPIQLSLNNAPFDTISNWTVGNGFYRVQARDSVGCVAWDSLLIREKPITFKSFQVLKDRDCTLNNTEISFEAQGDFTPFEYRLNGQVVTGTKLLLDSTHRNFELKIKDARGCEQSRSGRIIELGTIQKVVVPVTNCVQPNGSITLSLSGVSADSLSFSLDGGENWQAKNGTFVGLKTGVYFPMIRDRRTFCRFAVDSVVFTDQYCPPLAGFTRDTVLITQPDQLITLPWNIKADTSFAMPFSLGISLEGSGFPHLFPLPVVGQTASSELRSSQAFPRTYFYQTGQKGNFKDSLALRDSADQFHYPVTYVFKLEKPLGSPIEIDPKRDKLKAIVILAGPESFEQVTQYVCPGSCITIGKDLGSNYCYQWKNPRGESRPQIEVCPQKDELYQLEIIDLSTYKIQLINYEIKVSEPKVVLSASPAEVCQGEKTKISWAFAPGFEHLADEQWESNWGNQYFTDELEIKINKDTIIRVTIWGLDSECPSVSGDIMVKVKPRPEIKGILPALPFVCVGNPSSTVTIGPKDAPANLSYQWSNGQSTSSITVGTPGEYRLTVSNAAGCKTVLASTVKTNDPENLQSYFENGNFFKIKIELGSPPALRDEGNQPRLRSTGTVENRTVGLGEVNMKYLEYGTFFDLAPTAGPQLVGSVFADFGDKKVYITNNRTLCQYPNLLKELEQKIKEHNLGYWIHINDKVGSTQADFFITGSSYDKTKNAPVSADHKTFVALRLAHVASRPGFTGLSGPKTLQLICNSLVDNFSEGYETLNNEFEYPKEGDPISVNPKTNCATTSRPLNFVTAAGLVYKVPEEYQVRFAFVDELLGQVPPGALAGFTNPSENIYVGRFKRTTNEHQGYDNLSNSSGEFFAYAPLLDVSQPLEIWLGQRLIDASGKNWSNTLFNQTLTNGQTNALGNGPLRSEVIGVLSPATNYKLQTYSLSVETQLPEGASGWNILTGVDHVDKTAVNQNRSYIISIPVGKNKPPFQVFIDRVTGDYYVYNCNNGTWVKANDLKAELAKFFALGTVYDIAEAIAMIQMTIQELYLEILSDGHNILDVAGLIPVLGAIPDILNGTWYYIEGEEGLGSLSFASAVPGVGEAIGAKKLGALLWFAIRKSQYVTKVVLANGTKIILNWGSLIRKLVKLDLPDEVITNIIKNLENLKTIDPALLIRLFRNPDGIKRAWEFMKKAGLESSGKLYDPETLDIVMRQLDNKDFIKAIGGEDAYAKIIKDYMGGCSTCKAAQEQVANLPKLADLLKKMETWADKFKGIEGFETTIRTLTFASPAAQKAAFFVLELATKMGRPITAFEFKYLDEFKNRADFVVVGADGRILIEAKSWTKEFIDGIPSLGITTQLRRYLQNPPFEMWFDASVIGPFEKTTEIVDELTFIKSKYRELFSSDKVWEDAFMVQYFMSKGIKSRAALQKLELTHELFDFIRLLN